jgi:hypothetical protein
LHSGRIKGVALGSRRTRDDLASRDHVAVPSCQAGHDERHNERPSVGRYPNAADDRKFLMTEVHHRRRELSDRPTTAKGFRLELHAIALDPIDGNRGHPIDVPDIWRHHGLGPRHVVPAFQLDRRAFHEKTPTHDGQRPEVEELSVLPAHSGKTAGPRRAAASMIGRIPKW